MLYDNYTSTSHQIESNEGNRKICHKNCVAACTEWNYDANRGDNLCHENQENLLMIWHSTDQQAYYPVHLKFLKSSSKKAPANS
jgi:hypothetical protein